MSGRCQPVERRIDDQQGRIALVINLVPGAEARLARDKVLEPLDFSLDGLDCRAPLVPIARQGFCHVTPFQRIDNSIIEREQRDSPEESPVKNTDPWGIIPEI